MGEGDNDSKCEERYQTIDNQNKRSLMSDLLFLLLPLADRLLEIGYWRLAIGDWQSPITPPLGSIPAQCRIAIRHP